MLKAKWLGQIAYEEALVTQEMLVAERLQNPTRGDQLLLLEHPPTYTLGVRGSWQNLLVEQETLKQQGFAFHAVRRGGDITYHGPGQLVGYPIFNMKRANKHLGRPELSVRGFVTDIEAVIIQVLASFGIVGRRFEKFTGVWVETAVSPAKIAAIGIRVSGRERITSHGFAINVMPNMTHFDHIIPCGIQGYKVVSISQLLRRSVAVTDLLEPITEAFSKIFNIDCSEDFL